jgi:histidinol phosphatase-like PHP family hydrolase
MSQEIIYLLILLCIVISVIALFYIRRHSKLIKDTRDEQKQQIAKVQKRYDEQRDYLIESIHVISRAVGNDEKLTYTEACMRLTALLESLAPQLLQHADFSVIYEVYKRTEHIPIKDDWKKLTRQKQWTYKKEMAKVEAEFAEEVDKAARRLAEYDFNMMLH